jgi:hypothetical protein
MNCFKIMASILGIVFALNANAGMFSRTVHSRANCANNESITWWKGHINIWRVVSVHFKALKKERHAIDTFWQKDSRVAAIHWGEGVATGYEVWGYHYQKDYSETQPFATTHTTTCSVIEGW